MTNPEAGLENVYDVVISEQFASRTAHASQQHLQRPRVTGTNKF